MSLITNSKQGKIESQVKAIPVHQYIPMSNVMKQPKFFQMCGCDSMHVYHIIHLPSNVPSRVICAGAMQRSRSRESDSAVTGYSGRLF